MSETTDPTAGEGLSEAEKWSTLHAVDEFSAGRSNYGEVYAAVERIVAARESAARAEERERIAQALLVRAISTGTATSAGQTYIRAARIARGNLDTSRPQGDAS